MISWDKFCGDITSKSQPHINYLNAQPKTKTKTKTKKKRGAIQFILKLTIIFIKTNKNEKPYRTKIEKKRKLKM